MRGYDIELTWKDRLPRFLKKWYEEQSEAQKNTELLEELKVEFPYSGVGFRILEIMPPIVTDMSALSVEWHHRLEIMDEFLPMTLYKVTNLIAPK